MVFVFVRWSWPRPIAQSLESCKIKFLQCLPLDIGLGAYEFLVLWWLKWYIEYDSMMIYKLEVTWFEGFCCWFGALEFDHAWFEWNLVLNLTAPHKLVSKWLISKVSWIVFAVPQRIIRKLSWENLETLLFTFVWTTGSRREVPWQLIWGNEVWILGRIIGYENVHLTCLEMEVMYLVISFIKVCVCVHSLY